MKRSIQKELDAYVTQWLEENPDFDGAAEEMHHEVFNSDYYIIGYYQAEQWLKSHDLSVFEAQRTVKEYEEMHFGYAKHYDNAESLVNMLVYIYGEQVMYEIR